MSELESKRQILKSTGILGSVQVLTIIIGIVRIKVLAVLLGPVGVGISGMYQTIVTTIGAATSLGLNFSGVRDIATSAASQNEQAIAKTVLILRRWAWFTGLMGMLLTLAFCKSISRISFGDESYAWGVAVMSVALMLSAATGGMNAMLQGLRRINEVAKSNILGAIAGLVGAVVIYYFWGLKGIVPALLFTYLAAQLIAWYFTRKLDLPNAQLSVLETYKGGLSMARLGFFMVVTTVLNYGFLYFVRSFIIKQAGLEVVGYFIAAWTISSMYISAIFGAMGTDYYPRLSAIQHDHSAMKQLVNEQAEIALLITVPIITCMLSFIGLLVRLFYSKDFGPTADILSWQLLGDFIKVIGYPLGFVMLAKAKGKMVVITEMLWNIMFLGLVYFGWDLFGIKISGIAFLAAYLINVSVVFFTLKKMIGFSWSKNIWRYSTFFIPILVLAFLSAQYFANQWQGYVAGSLLTAAAAFFSYTQLKALVNIPSIVHKIKLKFSSN